MVELCLHQELPVISEVDVDRVQSVELPLVVPDGVIEAHGGFAEDVADDVLAGQEVS